MTGLLSLPPELLHEVVQLCSSRERCRLRATCKVFSELADPIVFRRLRLFACYPYVTEHQIITLATRSSKACEFTKDMEILCIKDNLHSTKQSLPHFGHCDDLRVHLPTAISTLKNMTCFRWCISDYDPDWLVDSLMQAVARLPRLTELSVSWDVCKARIPVGLFSNLSKLSVTCGHYEHFSFFIAQVATVIANSPQLRFLDVFYFGVEEPLPTLNDLFAKVSTKKPLCLEHLSIKYMDATVDQATLPHLKHLTSFEFDPEDEEYSIAKSVWNSFLLNNIKLSDVAIHNIISKETMEYLSSFSGLKKLVVGSVNEEDVKEMLFAEVLPKHVNSLQTLELYGWTFNHSNSKSIMSCLKLRDLKVDIDSKDDMTVQLVLDTVARLPELKILRVYIIDSPPGWQLGPTSFKPRPGLLYVEELEIVYFEGPQLNKKRYVVEDEGHPLGYREIPWFDASGLLI